MRSEIETQDSALGGVKLCDLSEIETHSGVKIFLDMLLRHRIQRAFGVKLSVPYEIETHFGVKKAIRSAIET